MSLFCRRRWCLLMGVVALLPINSHAQSVFETPGGEMRMTTWAKHPMLKDPVALSFGRKELYVVETARRSTVDIDIRSHKEWILEDLANQSVDDLRSFFRRRMHESLSHKNEKWLPDRNQDGVHDWRDLTTMKDTVRYLEDTKNDGVADASFVFADGFNEEVNGVAAGVLPVNGDVLMTIYPDLWKLKDEDHDGIADSREIMFRGFGVHAAFDGHDLHGLTFGPEGKIYFSVGDNGFSVTTQEGRKLHFPNTGGVLRMNPDGSDLEVYCYGTRNVQEIAFDKFGNLFSVDNDGDIEDERERFVHLVEGGDSGWRLNWQFRTKGWSRYTGGPDYNPWIEERMWIPHFEGQPAYIVPPISNYSVGPGGFKYNPGTPLNDHYQDYFFLCQFPVQKITAFRAKTKGASFVMENEHVFHQGLMASALNFGPDGAMYIADWVGKWSPNNEGVIYRLDDPKIKHSQLRKQVQKLIGSGLSETTTDELLNLLAHPDQRIRRMAQSELAGRNVVDSLLNSVNNDHRQLARIHAIWGIIETVLVQKNAINPRHLFKNLPWHDSDPEIRTQIARLAGELKLRLASQPLRSYLNDRNARVRYFAANALGLIRAPECTNALLDLIVRNKNRDTVLRHGAIMGLTGCATADQLRSAIRHESPYVRSAVVVAMRRRKDPMVVAFLADPQLWIAKEAAMAIHDDFSIPDALPALAKLLDSPNANHKHESIIRRSLSACLRLGRSSDVTRLLNFAADASNDTQLRIEALDCLAKWHSDPIYDRVEGRIRTSGPRDENAARFPLQQKLKELFSSADADMELALTRITREMQLNPGVDIYEKWVQQKNKSPEVRIEALKSIGKNSPSHLNRCLDLALADANVELRITALNLLAEQDPEVAIFHIEDKWTEFVLQEKQSAIRILSKLEDAEAIHQIKTFLNMYAKGEWPRDLQLDLEIAVANMPMKEIQDGLRKIVRDREKSSPDDSADRFAPLLYGGNSKSGESIYRNHVSAQCVRCHESGGQGQQAGPVLTEIGKKVDRRHLLEALLFPSKSIAKGFEATNIVTSDGLVIIGNVVFESKDQLTIVDSKGKKLAIAKQDIEDQVSVQQSSMPDVSKTLSLEEIRDLVEFLSGY